MYILISYLASGYESGDYIESNLHYERFNFMGDAIRTAANRAVLRDAVNKNEYYHDSNYEYYLIYPDIIIVGNLLEKNVKEELTEDFNKLYKEEKELEKQRIEQEKIEEQKRVDEAVKFCA